MDDRFKGRKIKCPKCGARVVHVKDSQVELLTAGTVPTAAPSASAPTEAAPAVPVPTDATPVATAVVPHLVGEFVQQSEGRQNVLILGGLLGLFTAALSILGIVLDQPLLVVAPIGIALTIVAVWLWMRKRKLEKKAAGMAKTEATPKL